MHQVLPLGAATQVPRAAALDIRFRQVSAKTTWAFLRLTLSNGAEGFGEVTDFGNEAALAAEAIALAARIATDRPAVMAGTLGLLAGRQVGQARDGLRSGLEQAMLDAMARSADMPLAVLLGGAWRDRVPAYANINRGIADRSPDGFAARAAAVVATEGYRAIKIAPFDGYRWNADPDPARLAAGLARVAAVRAAVGPAMRIMVDCHARFDAATARAVIDALAPHAPFWIEDPVDSRRTPPEDQRALRAAAHHHGIRIAGGEAITDHASAQDAFRIGGCDVILPDLRQTGIRRGMQILEVAVSQGIAASLHNPVGPVLDAVSRHVAAALPGFLILERQVRETPLFAAIAGADDMPDAEGMVGLGTGAGIGLVPDLSACTPTPPIAAGHFVGMAGAGPDA